MKVSESTARSEEGLAGPSGSSEARVICQRIPVSPRNGLPQDLRTLVIVWGQGPCAHVMMDFRMQQPGGPWLVKLPVIGGLWGTFL